jgi:hypothetical protein
MPCFLFLTQTNKSPQPTTQLAESLRWRRQIDIHPTLAAARARSTIRHHQVARFPALNLSRSPTTSVPRRLATPASRRSTTSKAVTRTRPLPGAWLGPLLKTTSAFFSSLRTCLFFSSRASFPCASPSRRCHPRHGGPRRRHTLLCRGGQDDRTLPAPRRQGIA